MSEDNQENGASNGDVPEIELIIKEESKSKKQLKQPIKIKPDNGEEYTIFELKSVSDVTPTYSYVIINSKEAPPPDISYAIENTNIENIEPNTVTEVISNPGPYIVSVDIPVEEQKNEKRIRKKEQSTKKKKPPRTTQKKRPSAIKGPLNQQKVLKAIDAVVKDGMTISQAAKAFEVTKSYLWKEVNKQTDQRKRKINEDLNKKIIDRICAGEGVTEISKSLNVAKSTVHMHKTRLAKKGKLPAYVSLKQVDKIEQLALKERIIEAFRGVRVNGMSLGLASKFFEVPRSTLWKHIQRCKALQKEETESNTTPTSEINNDGMETSEMEEEEDTVSERSESTFYEDEESTRSQDDHEEDFDILDAYCERHESSEEGDLLISFDFETFERYIKREFETKKC